MSIETKQAGPDQREVALFDDSELQVPPARRSDPAIKLGVPWLMTPQRDQIELRVCDLDSLLAVITPRAPSGRSCSRSTSRRCMHASARSKARRAAPRSTPPSWSRCGCRRPSTAWARPGRSTGCAAISATCACMCSTATGAYGDPTKSTEVPRKGLLDGLARQTGYRLVRSNWVPAGGKPADAEELAELAALPNGFATAFRQAIYRFPLVAVFSVRRRRVEESPDLCSEWASA